MVCVGAVAIVLAHRQAQAAADLASLAAPPRSSAARTRVRRLRRSPVASGPRSATAVPWAPR
jgi:hypothetical protein